MEKVSVIVPVYNGEKCIKRCAESILNQDYPELELILIDDGSRDRLFHRVGDIRRSIPSCGLSRSGRENQSANTAES